MSSIFLLLYSCQTTPHHSKQAYHPKTTLRHTKPYATMYHSTPLAYATLWNNTPVVENYQKKTSPPTPPIWL